MSAPARRSATGWLTTVNPVVKIAATLPPLVVILFTRDVATPGAIAIAALIALLTGIRFRLRTLVAGAAGLLVILAWTTFFFALLVRDDLVSGTPMVLDGWITMRAGAVEIGLATALRLVAAMVLALLGSLGTSVDQLASALVNQCRVPYRFAYGATATLRFVPRYREDIVTLRAAHRARGIIDPPGPIGYARRSSRSLIPLLAGGARHAERISLAMDARGFGAHHRRSDRAPAVVRVRDGVFAAAVWVGVAAVFVTTGMLGILQMSTVMYSV